MVLNNTLTIHLIYFETEPQINSRYNFKRKWHFDRVSIDFKDPFSVLDVWHRTLKYYFNVSVTYGK